jgi:uncharacterized protein
MIIRRFAYLLAFTLAPLTAQAQSFNCKTADRPDEVLICQDSRLSALDERMSSMYFGLRNSLGGSAHLRLEADQVDWLRARMGCGRDYRCISSAYDRRIGQLDNLLIFHGTTFAATRK